MSYSTQLLPLLLERAGVRRIKSGTYLFPLIQPSPSGEGFKACVDTYALWRGLLRAKVIKNQHVAVI